MKIETAPPEVESSAEFESMMMGIGDPVMIMKFLRNNLYSNKIGIVVQEYMSNARDAHREIGIPDRPIEVSLPTRLDPRFKVRDFGPGIDAERMRTAFTQYGISTKNLTNGQTGGFGIGCMSGFSYNDSFVVIVIIDQKDLDEPFLTHYIEESGIDRLILQEEGLIPNTKIKTEWVCFIDKTEAGEVSKVDEGPTDEAPGTTIIVPCKKGDRHEFKSQVSRVGQWWDPQPIVHGDLTFPEIRKSFDSESGKWCIQEKRGRWDDDPKDDPKAILDGIPYPLNLEAIYPRKDVDSPSDEIFGVEEDLPSPIPEYASELFTTPVRIYLETGEVSIAINREALDYGNKTRETLRNRISEAHAEIKKEIAEKLGESDNLWDACVAWGKIKDQFKFLESGAEWNGRKLVSTVLIPTAFNTWNRPKLKARTRLYHYDFQYKEWKFEKVGGYNGSDKKLEINDNVLLVEDDTECSMPPKTRMRTVLAQAEATGKTRVAVVKIAKDSHRETLNKRIDWEALNPIKLSEVPKTLIKYAGPPTKVAKARSIGGDSIEVDIVNGSGIYVAKYKGKFITDPVGFQNTRNLNSSYCMTEDELYNHQRHYGIKIVVVLERYVKKMGAKWVPFIDYARKTVEEKLNKPNVQKFLDYIDNGSFAHNLNSKYQHLSIFYINYKRCKDWFKGFENSDLVKWLEMSCEYREIADEISSIRSEAKEFSVEVRPPTISVEDLRNKVDQRHGMIGRLFKQDWQTQGVSKHEYIKQFTKYLRLFELENSLGVKA